MRRGMLLFLSALPLAVAVVPADEQTWGHFTRYGDVTELLASADDRLVVMRRGDAVELAFDAIEPPQAGEPISLLLDVELLYKPRTWIEDGRTAPIMQTAEPFPYRAMGWYPPPRPLPDDAARGAYLREWQTRVYERGALRLAG